MRRWTGRTALAITILILWQGMVRRPTPPAEGSALNGPPARDAARDTLRVAAFNIAGGVWPGDNRLDLTRTAKYLRDFDLIGMEEVHGGWIFDRRDQAHILGDLLRMPWLFAPSERQWWTDAFGNAALCSLPVTHWRRLPLSTRLDASNRTLLILTVLWHSRPLTVLITHIDRHVDHDTEIGQVTAAFRDAPLPVILMGDLNTDLGDRGLAILRNDPAVTDALGQKIGRRVDAGNYDWIFARGLSCVAAGLMDDQASDHPVAWAQLQ